MNSIKKLYSRVAPASKRQMNKTLEELKHINSALTKENQMLCDLLKKHSVETEKQIRELKDQISLIKSEVQANKNTGREIKDKLYVTEKQAYHAYLQAQESVWAHVWRDTTKNIEWLKNTTFSPGRWAVGYQYLYVLYRALSDVSPVSVLELGLGQSTRLISAYAALHPEMEHTVIEHDNDWIDFFSTQNPVGANTTIEKLELETGSFLDDDQVIMYKGFEEKVKGKKFDLISIDAPFGGKAKKYARVDVLKKLPSCLSESFIIMMDDFNRPGERETMKKIEEKLEGAGISYCKGLYCGVKQTAVITSDDWKFLCTL